MAYQVFHIEAGCLVPRHNHRIVVGEAVNIHMVAEVEEAAGIRSLVVAVEEEVRNFVVVCKLLALALGLEATLFLRIEIRLGWVLLRRWSSVSSMIVRSRVS